MHRRGHCHRHAASGHRDGDGYCGIQRGEKAPQAQLDVVVFVADRADGMHPADADMGNFAFRRFVVFRFCTLFLFSCKYRLVRFDIKFDHV